VRTEALALADRIAVLRRERLEQFGMPDDLSTCEGVRGRVDRVVVG